MRDDEEMVYEDNWCQICYKTEKVDSLTFKVENQTTLIDSLQALKISNDAMISEQKAKLIEITKKLADSVKEAADFVSSNQSLQDELEKEKADKEYQIKFYGDRYEKLKKQHEEEKED